MTDHCPLCNILERTVRNVRVDRIANVIQEYNVEQVIHIKGRENCLPDFLSRHPRDYDDLNDIDYGLANKDLVDEVSKPSFLLLVAAGVGEQSSSTPNLISAMTLRSHNKNNNNATTTLSDDDNNPSLHNNSDPNSEPENDFAPNILTNFSHNHFDVTRLKEEQSNDPEIQKIIHDNRIHSNQSSFIFKDNILYKLIQPSRNSKRKIHVVYLPTSMIKPLLYAIHNDPMSGGHFSIDRTYNKIRTKYWWPNMKYSIIKHIKACLKCQQHNINRQKKHGKLRPIPPPEGPFQLIGIDYCGPLKRSPRENQYVLVITDYFTRHIIAVALPNCTAQTTAQTLFNEYFCKFGIPAVMLSDKGPHFQNILMENISKLIGYNHIYSTPYHPQTNTIVERF
ncbi:unnamed protein product, partial [Didymodactylos carnosus]